MTSEEQYTGLREGNRKIQAYVFHLYREPVSAYLSRLGALPDDIKELYNDCILALFNSVKNNRLKEKAKIEHYLFGIARHSFKNLHRRKKKYELVIADLQNRPFYDEDIERILDEELFFIQLRKKLMSLGRLCQSTLRLYYLESKPWKEVAENLGISEDAARQRGTHCRKKLRKLMEEEWFSKKTTL